MIFKNMFAFLQLTMHLKLMPIPFKLILTNHLCQSSEMNHFHTTISMCFSQTRSNENRIIMSAEVLEKKEI